MLRSVKRYLDKRTDADLTTDRMILSDWKKARPSTWSIPSSLARKTGLSGSESELEWLKNKHRSYKECSTYSYFGNGRT